MKVCWGVLSTDHVYVDGAKTAGCISPPEVYSSLELTIYIYLTECHFKKDQIIPLNETLNQLQFSDFNGKSVKDRQWCTQLAFVHMDEYFKHTDTFL